MTIVERARNICLTPNTEWGVIENETTQPVPLLTGYAAPLAAIGAVAGFIGGSVVGRTLPFVGTFRIGVFAGLTMAVFSFVMALVGVAILAIVINALAPTFGGQKNTNQAFKLAVYSYTPAWVAAVLQILPVLGVLAILAGLYGIYLMYLGLPRLMKCPEDKTVGYTVLVVVCAIVLYIIIGAIGGIVMGAGALTTGALGGGLFGRSAPSSEVQFDKNSPLGKLQDLGDKMAESNKKMEEAQKKGDAQGEAAAAAEALGTLLGGGRHVDPVDTATLKAFIPDSFAGLTKSSSSAEKNGIAGLMVSKAEATYGSGGRDVTLTISDTGGASGLVGLASWAGSESDQEDANGSERTYKQGDRLVHEESSKTGGTNEYSIILGERFVVSAESSSVDLNTLKGAVAGLNLGKLEAMKDVGVKK
ncbi:MAG: YIP1 family protein [Acidobacteriota bacterium]|nr:YIP1 family protein [Acidobacteriota bacterium]